VANGAALIDEKVKKRASGRPGPGVKKGSNRLSILWVPKTSSTT
jgi:hypothetical protein